VPYNFKPISREQLYLLSPSIDEWLPDDHLARFVLDAVDQFDLEALYSTYRADGAGQAAYHPKMMVALLLYGYCVGERSSRRIERLCQTDVAFRVIAANQAPDHATLCWFRKDNEAFLSKLFTQVLRLCAEAGLVKLGTVALDGTKIKANAALDANRTLDALRAQVQAMLAEAQATDASEDDLFGPQKRGDELPDDLRDPRSRTERLKACMARLEQEAAEAMAAQAGKIAAREQQEAQTGRKTRGRKPLPPEDAVDEKAKANVTDPGSRIMKTRSGYVQGYNAQAMATAEQIIIAADVTQDENDIRQAVPMLQKARAELACVGVVAAIGSLLLDAGFCSEEALAALEEELGPEVYCATQKDWKQRKALEEAPAPRGRIPKGLSRRERMERKLRTKRGRSQYRKRGSIIEPVFGQIKEVQEGGQCSRCGYEAARSEWRLTCAGHNLLKLWRSSRKRQG
jgi:transposase